MKILLFASTVSPRLQYTCQFIFKEIMQVDYTITTDASLFKNDTGIKIKYANEAIANDHFTIGNSGLLLQNDIREQPIHCFEADGYKAFLRVENADLPFDIFSACFYLLSRYEEYLPHNKDMYGRYAHENSLAFKENFLHLPLINIWVNHFIKALQSRFTQFTIQFPPFTFLPTYDIDMAFSFKHKGWRRNMGGFIKSPSLNRLKVLLELNNDPFDAYEWLNKLHDKYNLQPLYFFLLAQKNGVYDKNILPHKKAMRKVVQQHAKKYATGIHPSWQSGDKPALLEKEKQLLEEMCNKKVTSSRQHYIRFTLPDGYLQLIDCGITDDYSMGYGSINGFRASVASSFCWFNLAKNQPTSLRIHPFCFMEANSFYEQQYTAAEAHNELMAYYAACKEVNGQLITIWHNNFLGTDPTFVSWKEMYEQFIHQLKQ